MKSALKQSGGDSLNNVRRPPGRLSWPASLKESSASSSNRKRPRRRPGQDTELWVNKFAPTRSSDLCVAPKKVKECKEWLEQAMMFRRQHRLLVLVGIPGCGKGSMIRVLAREMKWNVHCWNESFVARERGTTVDQVVSVEHSSALDSFEAFLSQCGAGFSSLPLASDTSVPLSPSVQDSDVGNTQQSLILLEDLPNLHGMEAAARFRTIMSQHLAGAQYASTSLICQIHPVTKPKMKKVLERIAHEQRCLLSASFLEEVHLQSGGDLRNAIMTLQVQWAGGTKSTITAGSMQSTNKRDKKLSNFHALGKLLYGKRKLDEEGHERLAFDPEAILTQSELGVGGSLRFLEYHSVDFFTDIGDIGEAYALFSDAAVLLDQPHTSYDKNALFPNHCASSIAGRAVANTNKHPAPNQFRQFSTPIVFDVIRKRRQNEALVADLAQRLSNSNHLAPSTALGGSHAFVTELLPSMRLISPNVVNPSVDNFYSIARDSMEAKAKHRVTQSRDTAMLKVQAEILGEDDIEDFDSDNEEKTTRPRSVLKNEEPNSLSQKENADNTGGPPKQARLEGKVSPEVIVID